MAAATKEASASRIDHAKTFRDRRYKGRKPSYSREQYAAVRDLFARDAGNQRLGFFNYFVFTGTGPIEVGRRTRT